MLQRNPLHIFKKIVASSNPTFRRQRCEERESTSENSDFPEEPTTCCMSGCANCVWLEYAEKLSKLYKDGGAKAVKEINERVSDPNMKAFLLHELRMRQQNQDNS